MTVDALTERFRARGLKVTPQRQAVFGVLEHAAHHPTADAVHAEVVRTMPTVSLRTVYQTLNDLVAMGELSALDLGTGATRFDPNLAPHDHAVCEVCGAVQDVHGTGAEVALPPRSAPGFEVTATDIVFRGRCGPCAGAAAPISRSTNQHTGGAPAHG